MEQIRLADYSIYLGDCWEEMGKLIKDNQYAEVAIIVDTNTVNYCLPILQEKLPEITPKVITIEAGERFKNIGTCQKIWKEMMLLGLSRKALTINLGGGVIGDMGGFCASTFKRGMDFIQVPTTLLSQVDASIGGKLGIDFMQVKNSIGLFKNPLGVFIDPIFYKTLSKEELRSGFAEIIKHSLIASKDQWIQIRNYKDLSTVNWQALLGPSLLIKKQIVEEDPFEKGIRKALNFGHTIGHAIEGHALDTNKPLLHGEAIAIGMVCESFLSFMQVGLSQEAVTQISRYILEVYGHYPLNPEYYEAYLRLMQNDKKNEGSEINFSLLPEIGQVRINQTCTPEVILQSLQFYNDLATVGV